MSTFDSAQLQLVAWLRLAPVVPVLTLDDPARAVPLARALVAGGLPVIEVTLRTPAALACMRAIAGEVQGAIVGAGTLLAPDQVGAARAAGARFAVSPGATTSLLDATAAEAFPFLPGGCTPGEVMLLRDRGHRVIKFFPAAVAGGVPWLRALAAPFPDVQFCPTGGIDTTSAREYLSLANVVAIGGSWLAPKGLVSERDWTKIEALAREACALRAHA